MGWFLFLNITFRILHIKWYSVCNKILNIIHAREMISAKSAKHMWVISEITYSCFWRFFCIYSQPRALLLLSHMWMSVLAFVQHHKLFCCFITYWLFCWFEQLWCLPNFLFKWFQTFIYGYKTVSVHNILLRKCYRLSLIPLRFHKKTHYVIYTIAS